MLHKSFKPAKCKTSLKLATSRIKLMRNKKGVQINQMKRDLAQLLETGQDRTARIRVEHVIREEKMVAAYDLIEIYCELIVARMPIIESQKTCPIDLKEAVTSVIFAAPRCSDISELADIKKQFTAKFGKEFVSAALELRPESGVSRMLVEKLSAVAPDIQTKVKVLTGVAKDHNINWEPTSFEEKESKPQNDLLNGPVNLETASMANANPNPNPGSIPSNINHVNINETKPGPPLDFAQQNRKYVVDNNVVGTSSSSGMGSERMDTRVGEDKGQNWNMGFKDATSAAEAAAESAERAAMAARAAAQFASHEKNPSRDKKTTHVSTPSGSFDENHSYERKPKVNYQQMDRSENEEKDNEKRVYEANSRSSKSNLSKESKTELESGKKEDRKATVINQQIDRNEEANTRSSKSSSFIDSENVNYFAEASRKDTEEASRKQQRDDKKVDRRSVVGNPFAVVDERNVFSESIKSKPDDVDQRDEEVVSDSDDDDGGPKFDTGFEYDEVSESSINSHIWSPRKKASFKIEQMTSTQSHLFSESLSFGNNSVKSTETEDRAPVSFDHSDSESEIEISENNKFNDILSANPEPVSTKSRIELNDLVEEAESSSFHNHENEEKKKREVDQKSYDDKNELVNQSNDLELKFGKLTGGLRHKGGVLKYPPYTKPATDAFDLSNNSSDEISLDSKSSKIEVSVSKSSSSESDLDDYSEKFTVPSSNPRSRFSPPALFFDDDDDGEEKEVTKQAPTSVRLRSELSRRTRGSPSISRSKIPVDVDAKPKTVISRSSDSRHSDSGEIEVERRSNARKTEGEVKIQMRTGNSDELGKAKEDLVKKPSYVHPKLPDYDTFAARLQSLRDERK